MDEYKNKSNSFKSRSKKKLDEEPKKVEKIIKGEVTRRKRSEVRRLADIFLPEDVESVKKHIFYDVVIPSIKKIISDTVDTYLYGESNSSKKSSTISKLSYNKNFDVGTGFNKSYGNVRALQNSYLFDDIILKNRGDAEAALEHMDELIDNYGFATVADLNELLGITGSYTDNNWGWEDIRSARTVRVRDGYMLKLPKAKPID